MVSGCVGFVRVFALIVRAVRSLKGRFVRNVSTFSKWSSDPAAARLSSSRGRELPPKNRNRSSGSRSCRYRRLRTASRPSGEQ
jgi:hypothetical protein